MKTSPEVQCDKVPDGMVEVSKDRFYAALMSEKRDIMPSSGPFCTFWKTNNRLGQLWGRSSKGWKNGGQADSRDPERFFISRDIGVEL